MINYLGMENDCIRLVFCGLEILWVVVVGVVELQVVLGVELVDNWMEFGVCIFCYSLVKLVEVLEL